MEKKENEGEGEVRMDAERLRKMERMATTTRKSVA